MCFNVNIFFIVGYDDRRMVLDGQFSYDSENQRALPFNVKISELPEEKTVFIGSTSKCKNRFFPHFQTMKINNADIKSCYETSLILGSRE